jgi:hypothetical protein
MTRGAYNVLKWLWLLAALALCGAAIADRGRALVDQNAPGPAHDGTTWDTAFLTIQDGVDAATPWGEVWVADGTYVENIVMGEGVGLYGGFLGAESGGYETNRDDRDPINNIATINGNYAGSCVVMAPGAVVDGFTVINGTGTAGYHGALCGGGFYCDGMGESGAITGNKIYYNSAVGGGGIWCWNGSSPLIGDNWIARNAGSYGGGIGSNESAPTVIDNFVFFNEADVTGGGIWWQNGDALIIGNFVSANEADLLGGGLSAVLSSSVVSHNVVQDNTAPRGAGFYGGGFSGLAVNNAISNNHASMQGVAVFCEACEKATFTCNTFTENDGTDEGRAFAFDSDNHEHPSDVTIVNCILWNEGGEIYNLDGSTIAITYSDVWGGWGGTGNIDADPLFADSSPSDWHLTKGSRCIDAGDNSAPGLEDTDWDSEPRIVNQKVDMGCDEYLTQSAMAPDPQPECDGPLFGGSQSGFPAWVWFSIPLTPDCVAGSGSNDDPNTLLGFDCSGYLWYWDKYTKASQVYKPPFVTWPLAVANSYLLYMKGGVPNPSYDGIVPFNPWFHEFRLGRQGWTWVGMPGLDKLGGKDFMDSVLVMYPAGPTGVLRTAGQDYAATPGNWIAWSWSYWNTWLQAPQTFTPYAPFGHKTCYPWVGYRIWVKVGTAMDEDDADQATLLWFKQ